MKRSLFILVAPLVLLVAACGSTSSTSSTSASAAPATPTGAAASSPTSASAVQLTTRNVAGVGSVLVDGKGRTLYSFAPDHAKKVTCVGGCATVWPPVAPAGPKPSTAGQVKGSLVSSDANPSGGRVITYAGWPLYLYVGDQGAGTANGQGLNANGGYWWAISPAGKVVARAASSSSGAGTASSGGGGYGY